MGLFGKKMRVNRTYIKEVSESGIFDNTYTAAMPQTVTADIIAAHFQTDNGKKNRALVIGFDGARADSMLLILKGKDEKVTGINSDSRYSAVKALKESGGLYITYAGGDPEKPETWQETSTAQGWAAVLTGKWGVENGVQKHVPLRADAPTVLMRLARTGVSADFIASWRDHFTITYSEEIQTAKRENIPLTFTQVETDEDLHARVHNDIEAGTECIFGIYEGPDANGHNTGFGNGNYRYVKTVTDLDRCVYEHLSYIRSRAEFEHENWLFVITSDHGGKGWGHGRQITEDRTTFLAVNKKV